MGGLRRLATITLVFATLSAIALVLSHLALTDIWHGEPDAHLEWRILQASGLVFAAFLGLSFLLSVLVRRAARG
jgi:hypothetical protein